MKKASKFWSSVLMMYCMGSTSIVHSNVVMTGTRVIYPAEQKEKTLQFSNNADQSYLVQIWLDKDNPQSTPETADAPFLINPQCSELIPNGVKWFGWSIQVMQFYLQTESRFFT